VTRSETLETTLRRAARRAYERGRLQGALLWGAGAALLALPAFWLCRGEAFAAVCLAGFALVAAAARWRGEEYDEGARAGAMAGILPCLLPALAHGVAPALGAELFAAGGPWLCAVGGAAAGALLGWRSRDARGLPFWGSAFAAMTFGAVLGCLPAGALGLVGVVLGGLAGAAPAIALRRAAA
jgi:hypothetical protein